MSIKKLQTKVFKKLRIGPPKNEKDEKQKTSNGEEYELQNLLEESSSDEDGDKNEDEDEDDSDDSWADETDNTLKESDFMLDGQDSAKWKSGDPQQLQMIEEEKDDLESQQISQFQDRMNQRTKQITNVTQSITNIHEIFQNLNELVQ